MSAVLGRRRLAVEAVVLPVIGVAVALAAFELAPRVGILPRDSFPPVSEILSTLADLLAGSELWTAVRDTLSSWALSMVLAAAIAIPVGMAMGSSRLGALLLKFTVDFLRPIPSVALIPILVLIYGTRPSIKVALATFGATFPLLFQAMYGVADVDPVAKDTARAFGFNWWARVRRITVPSVAPYLATGLRISASVALILVVTGEYVVGVEGLGQEVLIAQSGGAYDRMYAFILTTGVLGLALNVAMLAVERRVLFWHPSQRGRGADQ
jgi:ABC-type nitrate/sulfonate/bicarbonate transport system permease component